ncbi:Fur family transcriptional regulator Irr [Bradyrhizobium sp.]|uniref:Fur family transcriptional regulator Irr n=1 Tax=Bradyrhizobium sp. TaxID=376 RepID=UPI003C7367A1
MDVTTTTSWVENASEPLAGAATEIPPERTIEMKEDISIRHDCLDLLREAGLRPTQQRLVLGGLLFSKVGRHVTAEMLHAEATSAGIQTSMATVYNTLNQFTDAGLLRQIGVDGSKSFFDTNPTTHHHFFVDHEDRLLDVPEPGVVIDRLPQPLPGYEISRVDVIVHLRRKQV